jgi:hypothetical protein
MTSFEDGPAKGQHLMLKRAARFLRVVEADGKWDALDQPDDRPRPKEKLYAYEITARPGWCHLNCGRRGGGSGFYPIATYRLVKTQPADAEMRSAEAWSRWCESQPANPLLATNPQSK